MAFLFSRVAVLQALLLGRDTVLGGTVLEPERKQGALAFSRRESTLDGLPESVRRRPAQPHGAGVQVGSMVWLHLPLFRVEVLDLQEYPTLYDFLDSR